MIAALKVEKRRIEAKYSKVTPPICGFIISSSGNRSLNDDISSLWRIWLVRAQCASLRALEPKDMLITFKQCRACVRGCCSFEMIERSLTKDKVGGQPALARIVNCYYYNQAFSPFSCRSWSAILKAVLNLHLVHHLGCWKGRLWTHLRPYRAKKTERSFNTIISRK